MTELDSIVILLEGVFGESKSGLSDNLQIQFNCPVCAEECGLDIHDGGDGKYNLEMNIGLGKMKCWKCETTHNTYGKITKLLGKFGGFEVVDEYKSLLSQIKQSKLYQLNFIDNNIIIFDDEDDQITLPKNTYNFKFDGNKKEFYALNYLKKRNIGESLIKKYDLKYTTYDCPDKSYRSRIIIPSYNKYGELNYFTGRDYSEKNFRKYFNLEVSKKTDIIFNEHLINFDGDIFLVEGPLDHIVVPNSIPLLGKSLKYNSYICENIIKKAKSNVYIFLDDDAQSDSVKIKDTLCSIQLCDKVKIINTKEALNKINKHKNSNLKKLDPSLIYELFGYKGISWTIKNN